MKKILAYIPIAALIFLCGCGGGTGAPAAILPTALPSLIPTASDNSNAVGQAAPVPTLTAAAIGARTSTALSSSLDGCALLERRGVATIFGKALKEPGPGIKAGGSIASCKWTFDPGDGGDNPGTLTLQVFLPPDKPDQFYSQMRNTIAEGAKTKVEPVPGVGDKSMWGASELMGNLVTLTRSGLVVYLSGFKATDLDKMSALTKAVVAELSH